MVSSNCTVRPIQKSDLSLVSSLIRGDAQGGYYRSVYATDDAALATLVAGIGRGLEGQPLFLGDQTPHTLAATVLTCGDRLLGFALFTTREPDRIWTELWMMSIDPGQRHYGYGKTLFDGSLTRLNLQRVPVMARCDPSCGDMMNLLRHRGFQVLGAGPEGAKFLAKNFPQHLRQAFAKAAHR